MQQFKPTFVNEFTRVFRKKKTVVLCVISASIIILYTLINSLKVPHGVALSALGYVINMHSIFFMVIFPLFIFMETMDIFTGEMSSLTIRNALLRPVSRTKIYLAKACAVCAFILAQILYVGLLSYVASFFTTSGSAVQAAREIAAFTISFLPMAAFVFFAAFVSQIVKNGLLGMLLCILFLLVSFAAEIFAPGVSAFLFFRHVNLYRMLLTGNIQIYSIFSAFFIIASYIGVTFTAGALIFNKKDF